MAKIEVDDEGRIRFKQDEAPESALQTRRGLTTDENLLADGLMTMEHQVSYTGSLVLPTAMDKKSKAKSMAAPLHHRTELVSGYVRTERLKDKIKHMI